MAATSWTGRGDGKTWVDPRNWSAGGPAAGLDAVFGRSVTASLALDGWADPLAAGALLVRGGAVTLSRGRLALMPAPAETGNTIDLLLQHGADLTVAAMARIDGADVAQLGDGTGNATLHVLGVVAEAYGVARSGTLDVSGPKGRWISGDSGLFLQDSTLSVDAGGRVAVAGALADDPAAALDLEGSSTGVVAGAGSTVRLANVFLAESFGTSTLTVRDGGRVLTGGGDIGGSGDGTLTVSGTGSLFQASRGLRVGGQVPVNSEIRIEDGGAVSIGSLGLALDGTLALDASATLSAPFILSGGGTIDALAGAVVLASKLSLSDNDSAPFETRTTTLVAEAGATLTLTGAIGSAIPHDTSVTLQAGAGHIVLAHSSHAFAGTTAIYAATLEIAAAEAAGTGALDFVGGATPATLRIDGGLALHNVIGGFGKADTIDLAGFTFGGAAPTLTWTGDAAGGHLTLANQAHQHQTLAFAGTGLSAASFDVVADTTGGTALMRR